MCNNFLQQMEIDALEQLNSEDVKVQGQISCVTVSELASWSLESSPELLPKSLSELLQESSPEEMRSTSTTLLPGCHCSSPHSPQCAWTASSFVLRKKTLPHHDGCRWSLPTWTLRACTASSPGLTKNRPLPWSAEEDAWGGVLGRLLFITAEPHSLGGGGRQHRERQTGTWLRGLLAEPPHRITGHTCDGDEVATEMRKAEAEEGDRRRRAGQSVY
jgi:hypothetical protein